MTIVVIKTSYYLCARETPRGGSKTAVVAQLVEHQLPKLRVTSSSLAYRSLSGDILHRGISPLSYALITTT